MVHVVHRDDLLSFIIGAGSPVMGLFVSVLTELELWLRVISLVVGIAVGITVLIARIKKLREPDKDD